jgi:hypothetical protein
MARNDEAGTGPAKVQCALCKKLIPTSQAFSPEGHEYVLYFCGGRFHAEWVREQAEAARGGAKRGA